MKYVMISIFVMLLIGCSPQETEEKQSVPDVSGYVIASVGLDTDDSETEVKTFTVKATRKGFSPEVIEVNEGDRVKLYITNLIGDDTSGRDTDNAKRIGIEQYNVESFYHTGNTVYLQFVADKPGEFMFGDESIAERKGILVVNEVS